MTHQPPRDAPPGSRGASPKDLTQAGGRSEIETTTKAPCAQRTDARDLKAEARDEVCQLLQSTIHYAKCCQMHLDVDDDAVAVYDMQMAREYFIAAINTFRPLKLVAEAKRAEREAVE